MLVTVSFDRNDEQKVMDILHSTERTYKLFCSGTIESIAGDCGISCSKCNETFKETFKEDQDCGMNNDLLVIYASETKVATLELLCILAETGVTKVQTTPHLSSLFASSKLECNNCKLQKNFAIIPPPPLKRIKMESVANMETREAEQKVTSTILTKNEPYDSDDEEWIVTTTETNEDAPTSSNVRRGISLPNPFPAVPPQSGFKLETRQGRAFVEHQEKSQIKVPITLKMENGTVQNHNGGNITIGNGYAATSSNMSLSSQINLVGGVQKGEEQCKICNKTLKVAANRDYKVNMTYSMQSHSRVHIATIPLQCRVCNYECRFAAMITNHFRTRHASMKPTFNDRTSDADYMDEVSAMTKQCFPDWVPTNRRDSLGKGNKRPHDG